MNKTTFILLTIAVILSASCSTKYEKALSVIDLPDLTASLDSSTITWYETVCTQIIIPNLGSKGKLLVLPVDGGSQTASTEIFKFDFSKANYENEYAGMQADETAAKNLGDSVASAVVQFYQAFSMARKNRTAYKNMTDIIGGLKQAAKYIDPNKKNLIIIQSDMLQFSDKYWLNFEDSLNYDTDAERFMLFAEKIDLSNVRVIVLTGMQPNITPTKYQAVKHFWEIYFKACNATLVDYSSGAVSKLEEELLRKE